MKSFLFTIVFSVFSIFTAFTQWTHIDVDSQGGLNFVAIDPVNNICLTGQYFIYRSTNQGSTWSPISGSATFGVTPKFNSAVIVNSNSYVVVGRSGIDGLIGKTNNGGSNWSIAYNGGAELYDIAANGNNMVAVGRGGLVLISNDTGSSWLQIPVNTTEDLNTVIWNPGLGKWFIGGNNVKLTSNLLFPNSWNATTETLNIQDFKYEYNHMIETKSLNNSTIINRYNSSGVLVNSISDDHFGAQKTSSLPNGDLITFEDAKYYYINVSTNQLFSTKDSIHDPGDYTPSTVLDMELTSTFGLSCGYSQALGKKSSPYSFVKYVEAYFTTNINEGCPGDVLVGIPEYSYANSYNWYVDNQLVSTNDTLYYTLSSTPGPHTVKLVTSYNGITASTSSNFSIIYPTPPIPQYQVVADGILCENENIHFDISYLSGQSPEGVTIRILQPNGWPIAGPVSAPTTPQHVYINLPHPNNNITYEVQFERIGNCDTLHYSVFHSFTVVDSLENRFELLDYTPTICRSGDSLSFSLGNLSSQYTYEIKDTIYPNPNAWSSASPIGINLSTLYNPLADSVTFSFEGSQFYVFWGNPYNWDEYYSNSAPNVVTIEVKYGGCTSGKLPLFAFDVKNPYTFFRTALGTEVGKQVEIQNIQPSDSGVWSISPLINTMSNLNDTVPIFISNTVGTHTIKLRTEILPGCVDSLEQKHHFLMPVISDTVPECYSNQLPRSKILDNAVDSQGNYYECGYFQPSPLYYESEYVLRKISPSGNLDWEITSPTPSNQNNTLVMTAMEIGSNDMIYVASTNFNSNSNTVLEARNLSGGIVYSYYTNRVITDIEVTDDYVFFTSASGVYTLNHQLQLVDYAQTNCNCVYPEDNNPGYGSFYPGCLNCYNYIPRNQSIEVLPNGSVAFLRNNRNYHLTIGDTTIVTDSGNNIITALYRPQVGFYNVKKIATSAHSETLIHDLNGNLYTLIKFNRLETATPDEEEIWASGSIFDSAYENSDYLRSYLIKVDSSFNPIFIKQVNGGNELFYLPENENVALAGYSDQIAMTPYTENGFQIVSENTFQILPKTVDTITGYVAYLDTNGVLQKGFNTKINYYSKVLIPDSMSVYISQSEKVLNYPNPIVLNTLRKHSFNHCLTGIDTIRYCPNSPFVHYPYINETIDSIMYVALSDNDTVSGFFEMDVNGIIILSNGSSFFDRYIFYDQWNHLIDSVELRPLSVQTISIAPLYELQCLEPLDVTIFNSGFLHVSWTNDGTVLSGNHIEMPADNFVLGDTEVVYLNIIDINNCHIDTSFLVTLQSIPTATQIPTYYYMDCFDTLTVAISDSAQFTDAYWISLLGSVNQFTRTFYPENRFPGTTYQYSVETVDTNGCHNTTTITIDFCFSVNTPELSTTKNSCTLFPNPAYSYIQLNCSDQLVSFDIEIQNINGETILINNNISLADGPIDLEKLPVGYYFLKIIPDKSEPVILPFIKN